MDHLEGLGRPGRDTLIGNLSRSALDGAGLGAVVWGEDIVAHEGLGIYLLEGDRLSPLAKGSHLWRPDRISASHMAGDLELSEWKFVYDDTLVDELTFRNCGAALLSARVVVMSELEGRKAAGECLPVPGVPSALAVVADLQLSRKLWVALGTSRMPDSVRWAPLRQTVARRLAAPQGAPIQERFKQDLLTCGLAFDLSLAPDETATWTLAMAIDRSAAQALHGLRGPLSATASCREAATAAWQEFLERQVPCFECSWQELVDLYYYAWHVQKANRVDIGSRRFPWPFGVPAKFKYAHLWFWDACLQAITLRWLRDPAYCHGNMRTVANQQYPDGLLPHETSLWPGAARRNWPDGDGQSSSVTQPPVFGLALWEIYCATGDRGLLGDLWPALLRYDRWFEACRDEDRDHLYALVHRWETGWDNSPRWDEGFDVEPVEVNALIAIQREILAHCAEMFGRPDLAEAYRLRARQVGDAVRNLMWNAEAGTFCDLREGNVQSTVHTPAAFCTLIAGLPTPQQAAALVAQLVDPARFWTAYPVPCVAQDHPEFDPSNYWRGPTWIHINWLVIKGLLRYGYRAEATELVRRTFHLMGGQGAPTCNECYNPLTGEEARTPDLSWSGLVADLIVTCAGGLAPRADGQLECDPLDLGLDSFLLEDVPYRGHLVRLAFDRQGGYQVAVDGRVLGQRLGLGPLGPFAID